jgi:hydroxybutyrate-dimer hydrolase
MNLDGALALRQVIAGTDPPGNPLSDIDKEYHERIAEGISAIRATGDLKGKPVLVVHGMDDAILPVNHTSRPYAALNRLVEKESSRFRYYEVTNAHHLDMLNSFDGFNYRYIPLHYYYHMALDLLLEHLKNEQPLPPSHVVRTMPRGKTPEGEVNELKQINLPPISREPNGFNEITIERGTIHIPD